MRISIIIVSIIFFSSCGQRNYNDNGENSGNNDVNQPSLKPTTQPRARINNISIKEQLEETNNLKQNLENFLSNINDRTIIQADQIELISILSKFKLSISRASFLSNTPKILKINSDQTTYLTRLTLNKENLFLVSIGGWLINSTNDLTAKRWPAYSKAIIKIGNKTFRIQSQKKQINGRMTALQYPIDTPNISILKKSFQKKVNKAIYAVNDVKFIISGKSPVLKNLSWFINLNYFEINQNYSNAHKILISKTRLFKLNLSSPMNKTIIIKRINNDILKNVVTYQKELRSL